MEVTFPSYGAGTAAPKWLGTARIAEFQAS